ncbi:hypothetical protein H1S04_04960 [Paracoccus sp. S1E-3]|uniref:glycosyltransferase n=1 Tax=uncultured Paracoccus sp. TaxID=189685 RepID=UPI0015EF7A6E|nr:glycosyltransferase [Paracoccus sp. S1E-3]MBA4490116.1 hypothetical protein [Paracoccus sp. S1E-3]
MGEAIVGICRFSFLGWDDWVGGREPWQHTPARREKQRLALYASERLERRFLAFEQLLLPSIRAQTDPDFSLWMLTSDSLPQPWMQRLHDLCAGISQISIIVSSAEDVGAALMRPLRKAARANGGPVLQFRIDDDDALSRHFIARLRREARRLAELPRFAISFPRGLLIRRYGAEEVSYWRAHLPFIGAGAAVRLTDPGQSIFAFRHRLIPQEIHAMTSVEGQNFVILRWNAGDTAAEQQKNWPRNAVEIPPGEFLRLAEDDFSFLLHQDLGCIFDP